MLRVGKAGRTAFSFVPVDVGSQTGIFKRNGLDLQVASFGGDAKVQQAMAADSIDVGLGSGPGLAFIVKGSPVKGIAAMAGPPLIFALVARNDGDVKSVDDLKGRKVGISTVGSITSWLVDEVSRQKGWGDDGMTTVPIGEDGARVAALKSKAHRRRRRQSRGRAQLCRSRRRAHHSAVRRHSEAFPCPRDLRHR